MIRSLYRLLALSLPLLSLTLSLSMPLQAQIIIDPPAPDWTLTPYRAAAGQAFEMSVLSDRYGCASAFANHKIVVNEGRIDLSFTSSVRPEVLCPAVEKPYGPAFKIPALKAGTYSVFMNLLLPCHVAQPMCRAAIPVEEAGTLVVTGDGKISYSLEPGQVDAEQDFTLKLKSLAFGCNIDYLRTASRVQDGKITLTFLDKANPLLFCAPDDQLYGPSYTIPGLKAGTYEVWAERLPACVEQGCKILPVPELVDKLVVSPVSTARKGWFFKPREVKADVGLTLNVVNNDYGNCNTSFDHTSLVVQENAIRVSFVIVNTPDRVCLMDVRPHGPAFPVNALMPGRYPLFVSVMPACLYTNPRCLIIPPEFPTVASDTLIVSQTLSLGGAAQNRVGPMATWRDGAISVTLPQGAQGLWRAEVLGLSGRRLLRAQVDAGTVRGSAVLSGISKPDRGIVLLRLVSPARETHTLRVPVQD